MTGQKSVIAFLFLALAGPRPLAGAELTLTPEDFILRGPHARQQVLARAPGNETASEDVTRRAQWRTETPDIIAIDPSGVVTPRADGIGTVVASAGGLEGRALVLVVEAEKAPPVSFEWDVEPVLTRAGCNSGPCHGKASGQNGFQLSLLGFDPDFDHQALTRDLFARRVLPLDPERSLLLVKPTAALPHGGGRRLEPGGPFHETLRRWIEAGMPRHDPRPRVLERLSVEPEERILSPGGEQQILVLAHFADGSSTDVTPLASFLSSESPVASVSADGLVKAGPVPGDAAVMARFAGKVAVTMVSIPVPGAVPPGLQARLPRTSFLDRLVGEKLEKLGILPSEPAGDATFLRRAHIDVIGRLPTPAETRSFLADPSSGKREALVDRLLERPEYADHWAAKWMDLLRPNPYRVGIKAVWNLDAWIRDAFRRNIPYDELARSILTAEGSTFHAGAAAVFRDRRSPDETAPMMSQLFLGVRLECAKCHQHPFEAYGQEDFYSLASYFARVGYRGTGLSPPISGGEEVVFTAASGLARHPRTRQELPPRPLFGAAPELEPREDPRRAFAAWVTSPENPYFARAIVNRVWADIMGRGLVEPVDDLRPTNPPSNEPLLDALARRFREEKHDLKKLIRTIMTSHVYGLASTPGARNIMDTRNYSRHYRQRLRAEVVVDSVSDITGIPASFQGMPPGSRASEIWTHRVESLSLDAFGRPDPNQDPPCFRTEDTTLVQALHLMNSPDLHAKVTSDRGRATRLANSAMRPEDIVEEIYLLVFCRLPTQEEATSAVDLFGSTGADRRRASEDLLWALLNTPEFLFKD
ncbi:MAG TPA: DUF1549 and DUF1553 domain-containing protein [Planctomycetota bacterium]|nr:DUF1549 and DUF1553 domain-containing protein [Planctomycetota bacterium]